MAKDGTNRGGYRVIIPELERHPKHTLETTKILKRHHPNVDWSDAFIFLIIQLTLRTPFSSSNHIVLLSCYRFLETRMNYVQFYPL